MDDNFKKAFSLVGQVALVTGGGSGIGFSIAKCMISAGATVIIIGRRKDVLEKACAEIGGDIHFFEYDVTNFDSAPDLIQTIINTYGHCDIIVNNAGKHCKKLPDEITIQDFKNLMDVHLYGSFALTQAVLPYMKKNTNGSIIFISSESALIGLTKVEVYGSAKSALLGLTRCMAADVSEYGIRVNSIIPGFIDTPMFHTAVDNDLERQKKILGHTPMKKYGTPEDIGWATVYLCSKAASFVSGTQLIVDGGCSIGF